MLSRRHLLTTAALAGAAALTGTAEAKPAPAAAPAPDDRAADEDFWRDVQDGFTLDRTIVNLNNGGCCPTPRVVHEAFLRYLTVSNQSPVYHMWQMLEPGVETVRRNLAAEAGVDPEELAITRNASEALQIAQLGIELQPGDEVVVSDQDYPRMLDTWDQRVRRDGIVVRKVSFPVPPTDDDVVQAFTSAFGPKTKVVHVSHLVFMTGQILPVRRITDAARAQGIVSIVDGAHAFAHFPFKVSDLGGDYYGTSLHKWLLAPVGTGFLWMRKERIEKHWGLQPTNDSRKADIRKFEEIGTHPAANHDAVAEALAFHQGIGGARKAARLRFLRKRWSDRLTANPKVKLWTSTDDRSCAMATMGIEGKEPGDVTSYLWDKWRILATAITHAQFKGVRVTPNVYTTLQEIDTFATAIERYLAT